MVPSVQPKPLLCWTWGCISVPPPKELNQCQSLLIACGKWKELVWEPQNPELFLLLDGSKPNLGPNVCSQPCALADMRNKSADMEVVP